MSRWARGKFQLNNPAKYVGNHHPTYRSSWEWQFMKFCDQDPRIMKWASEAIKIPYKDPFTGRQTIYVPDFFIQYADKNGKIQVELIEVKPENQTIKEKLGRSRHNQASWIVNQAKWEAARAWCKQQGIIFRVVSEHDIFHTGRKR